MKHYFDRIGAIGTLIGVLAAAPACCLPLVASVGAFVGLSIFAPLSSTLVYLLQFFAVLSVFGAFLGFRTHHNWMPFALSIVSAFAIIYAYNVELSQGILISGLLGLVISAIWNTRASHKCRNKITTNVQLQSTITCPSCGHKQTETMPTDYCLFFYECPSCKSMLKPQKGDCCVFCSYGNVKCPPIQTGTCAC